ncbi:unnamed protein product [Camellia sinensis]
MFSAIQWVFKRSLMIPIHTILALSLIFQARLLEKANYRKKITSHMKRRNGISLHQEIESIRMGSGQIELPVMDTGRILIQSRGLRAILPIPRSKSFAFRAPQENFTIQDFELGHICGVGSYSKFSFFFLIFNFFTLFIDLG